MGIFYSSDALAASVDNILVKGDEMSADVVDPSKGNGGYVYGITGGNAYVDSTTTQYDELNGTTETVAGGLKGTVDGVNAIISDVGGLAGLDQSLIDAVGNINGVLQKAESANAQSDTTINGDTGLYLENYGYDWVRYYGAIGGDMSVNTGLQGSAILSIGGVDVTELLKESEDTSIVRNGNINNTINSGSVIGGIGGSAAVAVGNINGSGAISKDVEIDNPLYPILGDEKIKATVKVEADLTTNGKTSTTINGNVNTNVASNANAIGWTNGGTAVGLGGIAKSTINGNTVLTIDGTDRAAHVGNYEKPGDNDILPQLTTALNVMKGSSINAIGVTGGGMAVTTIGGTAESNVNGTTTININNATVLGAIGGGIAGSVDATGVAEAIIDPYKQYANNDGTTDFGIGMKDGGGFEILTGEAEKDAPIKVTVDEAIQGGTATATTGDTNIKLTGNSTAVGVIGGGVAGASHTYTWKQDTTNTEAEGYTVNDEYGKSEATATAGKSHITINLDNTGLDGNAKSAMLKAVSSFKDKLVKDTNNLQADELKALANKGAAVGVFGGGAAIAQSGNRQFIDEENKDQPLSEKDGAFATATTDGSQIDIYSGYVVGVMGGGIAGTDNNATAKSEMTDTVDININGIVAEEGEKSTEVVGVFGNGFAYFTGSSPEGKNNLKGQAVVTAEDTNINVFGGKVDGIVNGGLAIDDSQSNTTNAIVSTETGTINIGSSAVVNTINFAGFTGIVGNVPTDKINMASYVAGVKDAAENVAIAAGGVAVGGGAESTVENAEVNVFGTVNGDIIGGGVAAYGYDEEDDNPETDANEAGIGAHVDKSTLNLYAGAEINGNVYAGGSASDMTVGGSGYVKAQATVGNSTINLAGATVTGVLSGKGVSGTDNDKALKSFMNVSGENTLGLVDDNGTKVSKISAFNETNFSAGSVTTLDGGLEAGNTVAVINGKLSDTKNGVITVADGAKLNISELTAGKGNTYLVASDYAEASSLWANDALAYDRTENYAAINEDENGYKITYEEITDANVDEATDSFVDAIGDNGEEIRNNIEGLLKDPRNTFSGFDKFMEDASTSVNYADVGKMAMIGEAAGVTSNTIDVAGDMADNSVLRLSFTQDNITGEPKVNEDGAIWAKYIHNKHDLDGMASSFGSVDSSSDFDGATIGVDFAKKGKVQSGIAFSYGSGDSHGMGINNDFDMWGVSLYGNVKNDDTNVIADIGFSESDNELTGTAMGKDIKADRDVSVFTVGVRAEKLYTNGSTQIVPYTGLRYYNVDPDSYTAYYDGQKFGEYDADRQNIWTLPVGVSLRNETVTESGWRLTPKVDVAYIWAFGDTDNSFDLNTGSGVDTLDYTVMDSGSWLGSVGFEAGKDDWAFGVGYSYQKGSHEEANKWFVNVEYSF